MLLMGILLLTGTITHIPELTYVDSDVSWGFVLLVFGGTQVYSIYDYPKLELLRVLMSWFAGCIWVWIAVASPTYFYSVEDISTLMLGIGNLYGFIINFNLLKISWTD